MRKIFLLSSIFISGMLYSQERVPAYVMKSREVLLENDQQTNGKKSLKGLLAGGDTIFHEDFGGGKLPTGWTNINTDNKSYKWIWYKGVKPGSGYFQSAYDTVRTTTAKNGYMLFTADSFNAGNLSNPIIMNAFFQTPAINCSKYQSVILRFQQYFRFWAFSSSPQINLYISNDSINWTKYNIQGKTALSFPSDNPDLVEINISGLAALKDSVYLRFSTTGLTFGFCVIDDISLTTAFDNDLQIDSLHTSCGNYEYYYQIPKTQVAGMTFNAGVYNAGLSAQTNISLNVKVKQGSSIVYNQTSSTISSINPQAHKNLNLSNSFLPSAAITNYKILYKINQSETDDAVLNNSDSLEFGVSDLYYCRGYYNSSSIYPALYGGKDGDFVGTQYYLPNDDIIGSFWVFINPETSTGSSVAATLLQYDSVLSYWNVLYSSDYYTITSKDINNWVLLKLSDPSNEFIVTKGLYCAGVNCYGNVQIGADNRTLFDDTKANLIGLYTNGNPTWYHGTRVPLVSMNMTKPSGIEEIKNGGIELLQNYPNPFNASTEINYQLINPAKISLDVFDITGKKVMEFNEGNKSPGQYKITIDAGNLDNGIYSYSLKANDYIITKRMVVLK